MINPSVRKCPGCGIGVAVPADRGATDGPADEQRLDQLARAACGCWVLDLPDNRVLRLVRTIMSTDGVDE